MSADIFKTNNRLGTEITQAEYNALSSEEKSTGTYWITDAPASFEDITESNINAALDIDVKETLNAKVSDVKINGKSVLDADKVANIPIGKSNQLGLVKPNGSYGVGENGAGLLILSKANDTEIIGRNTQYKAIVPTNLVKAVDSVLCSTTASEALTAEQQKNACSRLGIVICTQAEYDAMTVHDKLLYIITE